MVFCKDFFSCSLFLVKVILHVVWLIMLGCWKYTEWHMKTNGSGPGRSRREHTGQMTLQVGEVVHFTGMIYYAIPPNLLQPKKSYFTWFFHLQFLTPFFCTHMLNWMVFPAQNKYSISSTLWSFDLQEVFQMTGECGTQECGTQEWSMDFCSVSWTDFRVPNLRGGMVFEIFYMFSICMGCDPFRKFCDCSNLCFLRGDAGWTTSCGGVRGSQQVRCHFCNLETCPNFKRFHSYSLRKVANILIYSLLPKNGWKIPLWLG